MRQPPRKAVTEIPSGTGLDQLAPARREAVVQEILSDSPKQEPQPRKTKGDGQNNFNASPRTPVHPDHGLRGKHDGIPAEYCNAQHRTSCKDDDDVRFLHKGV
jgi:hypothetical protein